MEIGNNDSADDMKNVDLTKIHYLSGPFEIEDAEPGDVLIVDICDVRLFFTLEMNPWRIRVDEIVGSDLDIGATSSGTAMGIVSDSLLSKNRLD